MEKDPTAFCTQDGFTAGYAALKRFFGYRAGSVRKQLDGELATVSGKQDASCRVDASGLRIMDLRAAVKGADGKGKGRGIPASGVLPENQRNERIGEVMNDVDAVCNPVLRFCGYDVDPCQGRH